MDCFSTGKSEFDVCTIDSLLADLLNPLLSRAVTRVDDCVIDALLIDLLNPLFWSSPAIVDATPPDFPVNVDVDNCCEDAIASRRLARILDVWEEFG